MTVQNQNVKNVYRGNGSTTVFPFTFAINKEHPEYIHVYIKDDGSDDLLETRNFTCDMEAKTITYPKGSSSAEKLSATQRLMIRRIVPYKQNLNLVNQGPFFSEDVETELDELEMQIQQLADELGDNINPGGDSDSGCDCDPKVLYFEKAEELTGANVSEGKRIKTFGFYHENDGGGADYEVRFIPDAILSRYPWAIRMADSEENEYEIVYKEDGMPLTDANGEYVLVEDLNGDPIPVLDRNGKQKKKALYACITEKVINYRMFGAKLDGETDDEVALVNAHLYQKSVYTIEPESRRRRYLINVENHEGIICKGSKDPIVCAGNIDLTGSKLVLEDCNAGWYGFFLWGDNEEDFRTYEPYGTSKDTYLKDGFVIKTQGMEGSLTPNSILNLKETPYAVRDDDGYLYSAPRYELLLHTMDGVLANPFGEDWNNAGGAEISSTFSDYVTHEIKADTVISHLEVSVTRLPAAHYYFKGCEVKINTSANKYATILWCKHHNAHISKFSLYPDTDKMNNTIFKNAMFYIWGCYNVEISEIVGFNSAGKKDHGENTTSGYIIRATNCLNLNMHDISVQGYWGDTACNCVKDVHISRVNCNRLDIHNYFYNLFIDQCNLYNHSIQIGEGHGIVQITNTNFYVNYLADDSYPHAHMVQFNATYGRIFEGRVLIANCNAFIKGAEGNEFDVCRIIFSPEAVSILPHFKFPEVTIRDCHFYSYDADTYLAYFMIAGSRNCKTALVAPTNVVNQYLDTGNDNTGTLRWEFIGRGIDWQDNINPDWLNVIAGQFIRTYEKYETSEGKTVFYNLKYFVVTVAGTLPVPTAQNKPSNYSGEEFLLGTARVKYVEDAKWMARRNYALGDFCFTDDTPWLPIFCYECVAAGLSNGYRPVHLNGTVIDGIDIYPKNLDAVYWEHVSTLDRFITRRFSPNMTVESGEIIYADHKLYKVVSEGNLRATPPTTTGWGGRFTEGTAVLSFIGKDWEAQSWWAQGFYCVSDVNDTKRVYRAVQQDGITSGDIPVPGNARCIDGDVIWEYTTEEGQESWQAETRYAKGDVVSANGNNYKCIFDGKLELPYQTVLENISTNMVCGDVFAFDEDTDVPTKFGNKNKWDIRIANVDVFRINNARPYFGNENNPYPVVSLANDKIISTEAEEIISGDFSVSELRLGETLIVPDTVVTLDNSGDSDWDTMVTIQDLNSIIGVGNTVNVEYAVWMPSGNKCATGPEFIIYTARGTNQRINALAGTMHKAIYDNGILYKAVVQYTINANGSEFPFYKSYGANSGSGEIKARLRISNLTQEMEADVVSSTLYPWD